MFAILAICFSSSGFSQEAQMTTLKTKRPLPREVPSVEYKGIIYTAPHHMRMTEGMKHEGGYIEAKDRGSGKRIWLKEAFKPHPEEKIIKDGKSIFITSLEIKDGCLIARDEFGDEVRLPLD
jgi:hypothetical protein